MTSTLQNRVMAKFTFTWLMKCDNCSILKLYISIFAIIVIVLYIIYDVNKLFFEWTEASRSYNDEFSSIRSMNKYDSVNLDLEYAVIIDAGSSGSRVYLYAWPPHDGKSQDLLRIQPLTNEQGEPIVQKISPGLSSVADNPERASDYIYPLLSFASNYITENKRKQTPLYILATAGLRLLEKSVQEAILNDLREDIPQNFSFVISPSNIEVISGKQEGVYQWIAINFVLGNFYHSSGESVIAVDMPEADVQNSVIFRKRTVGILDMGGASLQLAVEVTNKVDYERLEEGTNNAISEINLGCMTHDMDHSYKIYVMTFLGMGANEARDSYEESLLRDRISKRLSSQNSSSAITTTTEFIADPCLAKDYVKKVNISMDKLDYEIATTFKGTGDFEQCQTRLMPLIRNLTLCPGKSCLANHLPLQFEQNEFYGFSEFWYSMEDVFREGGQYNFNNFKKTAKNFCSTPWAQTEDQYKKNLYPLADWFRITHECFKAAWMTVVLHNGLNFKKDFNKMHSSPNTVHHNVVHWTLGAVVHRTRFFPLKELQKNINQPGKIPQWSLHLTHHMFIICFGFVLAAILLYLQRLQCLNRLYCLRRKTSYHSYSKLQDQMEMGYS